MKFCDGVITRMASGMTVWTVFPAASMQYSCMAVARPLQMTDEIRQYLFVERKISFDGFVSFEGRRFGVPYRYTQKICRVARQDFTLYIYSDDMRHLLAEHNVTWSRKDSFCKDQYRPQPEEYPTAPVTVHMHQNASVSHDSAFDRFNFDKEVRG